MILMKRAHYAAIASALRHHLRRHIRQLRLSGVLACVITLACDGGPTESRDEATSSRGPQPPDAQPEQDPADPALQQVAAAGASNLPAAAPGGPSDARTEELYEELTRGRPNLGPAQAAAEGLGGCFGAQGADCAPIHLGIRPVITGDPFCGPAHPGGPSATCISDAHFRPAIDGDRLQYQAVTVGSLLHDQCCFHHPNAPFCGGDNSELDDCVGELRSAISAAVSDGWNWRATFDISRRHEKLFEVTGNDQPGYDTSVLAERARSLRAPFGTYMLPKYARFCQSGVIIGNPSRCALSMNHVLGRESTRFTRPGRCVTPNLYWPATGFFFTRDQLWVNHGEFVTLLGRYGGTEGEDYARGTEAIKAILSNGLGPTYRAVAYVDGFDQYVGLAVVRQLDSRDSDTGHLTIFATTSDEWGPELMECVKQGLGNTLPAQVMVEPAPSTEPYWLWELETTSQSGGRVRAWQDRDHTFFSAAP
jgi:hypothetical protein